MQILPFDNKLIVDTEDIKGAVKYQFCMNEVSRSKECTDSKGTERGKESGNIGTLRVEVRVHNNLYEI